MKGTGDGGKERRGVQLSTSSVVAAHDASFKMRGWHRLPAS